jgi:hypothetical protein
MKNLKEHLRAQIIKAKQLDSKWVYILREEAKTCLELAEAEIVAIAEPVEKEIEGGGSTWWYVCSECHGTVDNSDKYCKHCGRKFKNDCY